MENRNEHPNMLGAAVFAFVLGTIFLGLSAHALYQGQQVDAQAVFIGCFMFMLGTLALDKREHLAAMTPAQRDAYWKQKESDWQALAESRVRAELGDDYRPKR